MTLTYHQSKSEIPPKMVDGAGFNKTAIITGCASGIGLATTQLFLSHQYNVFGVDISEMNYAKVEEKDQERFHFHRADLRAEGQCEDVVRICVAEYGYVSAPTSLCNLLQNTNWNLEPKLQKSVD
jgi:NAD(P)-dependent dehydrogenase (short-subunit alcohol dehydrogenase family)